MSLFNGLTEENLKKIHIQEKKITGEKETPRNHVAAEAKIELEDIYTGSADSRINEKYAKETLIAYEYSKTKFHYNTGNSMLKDIVNGKKIYFFHYI